MSLGSDSLLLSHELVCIDLGVVEALRYAVDAPELFNQACQHIVVDHHVDAALEHPE